MDAERYDELDRCIDSLEDAQPDMHTQAVLLLCRIALVGLWAVLQKMNEPSAIRLPKVQL